MEPEEQNGGWSVNPKITDPKGADIAFGPFRSGHSVFPSSQVAKEQAMDFARQEIDKDMKQRKHD